MKNTFSNVMIFAVGAAIGSAVTYYFVKNRYEDEIASLVEDFSKALYDGPRRIEEDGVTETIDIPEETVPTPTINEVYTGMVNSLGYRNYSDIEPVKTNTSTQSDVVEEPCTAARVITPTEFGENDYNIVELTYWADGVLTDNKNKRIQDVGGLLGNALERFGEYEPDALHVRNDDKKIDFEIVRDLKRYSDFFGDDSPHQAEVE